MDSKESLNFYQGKTNLLGNELETHKKLELIKEKIKEFLNLKNVLFLFGSGTSSGAIRTMSSLFSSLDFTGEENLKSEFDSIVRNKGENLEECLSVMYAARAYYEGVKTNSSEKIEKEYATKGQENDSDQLDTYVKLIQKVEKHIFDSINIAFNTPEAENVLDYYKTFYQKLALRSKDLSRLSVFTTNNDLFNEKALDELSIHYINGFSGGIHRYFNPALFNYTWSKRMDTSIDKYEPIDNMVYLYKIHGSINWRETQEQNNNYFEIEEVSPSQVNYGDSVLVYPTPTKQDKSLGCPYVDLFREFQHQLLQPHSVLFVIGYSFSDRHVNEIIYRALATNSSINIVIFGCAPTEEKQLKARAIFSIKDNRIFVINGRLYKDDEEKNLGKEPSLIINHFDYIVNELLPNLDASRSDDKLLNDFIERLKEFKNEDR